MDRAAGPKFLIFMSFALEDRLVEAVEELDDPRCHAITLGV